MKRAFALLAFAAATLLGATAQESSRAVVHRVIPVTPAIARQANISGVVKLQVTVAPSGKVSAIVPIGGNPIFIEAAVNAVKQWVYAPADQPEKIQVALMFKN